MRDPSWSPDGKRLAVVVLDRIWTMQPDGREGSELTKTPGIEREPAWSPDGKRIAFAADRGDGFDLYVVTAHGGAPRARGRARRRRAVALVDAGRSHRLCQSRDGHDAVGSLRDRSGCGDGQAHPAAAHAIIG